MYIAGSGYALAPLWPQKGLYSGDARGSQFPWSDVDHHKSIFFISVRNVLTATEKNYKLENTPRYSVYSCVVGCHVGVDWWTGQVSIRKLAPE